MVPSSDVNSFLPLFKEDLLAAVDATEATVGFDATGGGTLATDSLTTFNTSLRQLYPDQVHPAKLEEMKQSFCPCVAISVAEVLLHLDVLLHVSRMGKSGVTQVSLSAHRSPPVSLMS